MCYGVLWNRRMAFACPFVQWMSMDYHIREDGVSEAIALALGSSASRRAVLLHESTGSEIYVYACVCVFILSGSMTA